MIRNPGFAASLAAIVVAIVPPVADARDADKRGNTLFPTTHRCFWDDTARACATLRGLMSPDWSRPEQLIILPHRGYWGFGDVASVPENSRRGYDEVSRRGYDASEVDFMSSQDGVVMSHDYVLYRVTAAPPSDTRRVYDLPTSWLSALSQRDRFGVIRPQHKLQSARDAFAAFKDGGRPNAPPPLIFADIKQKPIRGDAEQYARNWVDTLSRMLEAAPEEQLYQIVVKTPYTPEFILAHMSAAARPRYGEILWMPQVGSDGHYRNAPGMGGEKVASSADFVDVWKNDGVSAIAAFETNWKTPDDSRLHTVNHNGFKYLNILHYIKVATNRRGGVFAEEPVGQRGVVNRLAVWEMKNADTDRRGDFMFEAAMPVCGNFMVVTTDRPDIWAQVRREVWPETSRSDCASLTVEKTKP